MKEQIISQGAAGCIYKYGVDCRGIKLDEKFVTKIQRNENLSNNEANIGKRISVIPYYSDHFAPVVECCDIHLATYDNDEIEKCEFIQKRQGNSSDRNKTYKMCKIPYVGKDTLADYIYDDIFEYTPKQLVKTITGTYSYLLKSLKILADNNIVHYDIKENNIVCNKSNTPIIIDFGRSIDITDKKTDVNKYKSVFFLYEPEFNYWCLDINFLMYMFNELGEDWKTQLVKEETVLKILGDFFTKTNIALILQKSFPEYRSNQTTYFTKFVGKKWLDVFKVLIQYMKTWDNYALSVTYFEIVRDFGESSLDIMISYNDFLTHILTSTPDKRPTLEETIAKTTELFSAKLKKDDVLDMYEKVKEMSKNTKLKNRIMEDYRRSKMDEIRKDERFDSLYGVGSDVGTSVV